jgi:hypothetical protein
MGFGISTCKLFAMMTLRNMREHGVHTLAIRCGAIWCNHEAILDVSAFADGLTVPSFGPRMVCTVCGAIGADARPNWNERAPASLFGPRLSN